jgi:hypothetical protein
MSSTTNFAMLASDVSFDKLKFSDKVTVNSNNNGRTIYASYSDPNHNGLVLETPWMKLPYGVSVWSNDGNGPDRHSLNMSFASEYSKVNEVDEFKQFIQNLDEFFVAQYHKNSGAWKQKTYLNPEVVRELYTSMYKVSVDKDGNTDKYPPTFKLNLPQRDGEYTFPTVDSRNKPIVLTKANSTGAHAKAIIKCVGMWLAGGKFGCTWRLTNLMVIPKDTGNSYKFRAPAPEPQCLQIQSDEEDEDEDEKPACKVVNDDDEDDDDIDVPPPVLKNKY